MLRLNNNGMNIRCAFQYVTVTIERDFLFRFFFLLSCSCVSFHVYFAHGMPRLVRAFSCVLVDI